eukprot:gene17701-62317_t
MLLGVTYIDEGRAPIVAPHALCRAMRGPRALPAVTALWAGSGAAGAASAPPPRPHIVFYMVDDWGWADVGYHRKESGAPEREVATPNIDQLVRDGVELDRHYVYRWCTPTRSSFLSGRLPVHVFQASGHGAGGACNRHTGIPRNMTVISAKLKAAGYSTHQFGKWDAGMSSFEHIPKGRGFDTSLGYFDHCNDYYTYRAQTPYKGWSGFGPGPCSQNQSITDLWDTDGPAAAVAGRGVYEEALMSQRATDILAAHDPEIPLFFYYAFHLVHADPDNRIFVPAEWLEKFKFITDSPLRRVYHAGCAYMDAVVGNITRQLKAKGMWEHSLVVRRTPAALMSQSADNGGLISGGPLPPPAGGVRVNAWVSGGF